MSALDAIYRVPRNPRVAHQGPGHRIHRMRRRHGRQRERRRRTAGRSGVAIGGGSAADALGDTYPPATGGRGGRRGGSSAHPRMHLAVGCNSGRRRRRTTGLRVQRPRPRSRRVVAAARAKSPTSTRRWPMCDGRRAQRSFSTPRGWQAYRRCSTGTSARATRCWISPRAQPTSSSRSRDSRRLPASDGARRRPCAHRRNPSGHRRRDPGPGGLPLARSGTRSTGCQRHESPRSTRSRPGTSGTARSRWHWREQSGRRRRRPIRERRSGDQVHAHRRPTGRTAPRRGGRTPRIISNKSIINQ